MTDEHEPDRRPDGDRPDASDFDDRVSRALAAGSDAADAAHGEPVVDADDLGRRIRSASIRRTRVGAVAAASVLVLAAAASFGVGRSTADRSELDGLGASRSESESMAPAAAALEPSGDVATFDEIGGPVTADGPVGAPVGVGAADSGAASFSPYGSAPAGGPTDPLFTRTATDGTVLDVRTGTSGGWAPTGDVPFWDPPGWCFPSGTLYVGVRAPDSVGQLFAERYDAVRPGDLVVATGVVGVPERSPRWVAVVQVPAGVTSVRATFADGRTDTDAVRSNTSVLTTAIAPGFGIDGETSPEEQRFEGLDTTGAVVASWTGTRWGGRFVDEVTAGAPPEGDAVAPAYPWSDPDCQAPTELPAAGEQPADPAAAETAVRSAWSSVMEDPDGDAAGLVAVVDDPTGLVEAREELRGSSMWETVEGARLPIDAVVFVDPTTAYFRYSIFLGNSEEPFYVGRFGEARFVDGAWKVTRASACSPLALAGVDCG